MPVQIGCAACGKKYRVDDKLLGKKIRCKNCQGVIRVEGAAQPLAAAKSPAPSVKKAAPAKSTRPVPAAMRSAPQSEALDLPDLSGLDVPPGRTIELDDAEMAASAVPSKQSPACPSCGAAFPAANKVCMECGYHRASGQRAKTHVEKSSLTRAQSGPQHDSSGKRLWQPYDNPILDYFDTAIPKAAILLFLGLGIVAVVVPIAGFISTGRTVPPILIAILLGVVGISMGLFYSVVLTITMAGVKIAGSIFKFEAPEDGRARLIAMHTIAFVAPVAIFLISVLINPHASRGFICGLFLFAVAAYFLVCFACFKILFHLKVVEAMGSYLIMLAFYVMGTLIYVVLDAIILELLKGVIVAAFPHHG